jgi:hypothetical protein
MNRARNANFHRPGPKEPKKVFSAGSGGFASAADFLFLLGFLFGKTEHLDNIQAES